MPGENNFGSRLIRLQILFVCACTVVQVDGDNKHRMERGTIEYVARPVSANRPGYSYEQLIQGSQIGKVFWLGVRGFLLDIALQVKAGTNYQRNRYYRLCHRKKNKMASANMIVVQIAMSHEVAIGDYSTVGSIVFDWRCYRENKFTRCVVGNVLQLDKLSISVATSASAFREGYFRPVTERSKPSRKGCWSHRLTHLPTDKGST